MFLGFVLLVMWSLWTPDLDRADLERQYTRSSSQFIATPGLRTHVQIEGLAQAPVVLLLHGFGSSLQTWDVWADGLATDHRVVRLDIAVRACKPGTSGLMAWPPTTGWCVWTSPVLA